MSCNIRRTIGILLTEFLFVTKKFPGTIVLHTLESGNSRTQPCLYTSQSRDGFFLNERQNTGQRFPRPHGPAMYTLSLHTREKMNHKNQKLPAKAVLSITLVPIKLTNEGSSYTTVSCEVASERCTVKHL